EIALPPTTMSHMSSLLSTIGDTVSHPPTICFAASLHAQAGAELLERGVDINALALDLDAVGANRRAQDDAVGMARRAQILRPDADVHAAEDALVLDDPASDALDAGIEAERQVGQPVHLFVVELRHPALEDACLRAAFDRGDVAAPDGQLHRVGKRADLRRWPDRAVEDDRPVRFLDDCREPGLAAEHLRVAAARLAGSSEVGRRVRVHRA